MLPIGSVPSRATGSTPRNRPEARLVEELIQDGVEFRERARVGSLPLPWKKRLTAEQVMDSLGARTLLCTLPGGVAVPLKDLESLTAVGVFEKKLPPTALTRPELATGLGRMSEAGWLFNDAGGKTLAPAEAYQQMRESQDVWAEHPYGSTLLREDRVPGLGEHSLSPTFRLEKLGIRYQDGAGNDVAWDAPGARLMLGQDAFKTCHPALLEQLVHGLEGDCQAAVRLGGSLGDYAAEEARTRADWIRSVTRGEAGYLVARVGKALLPLPRLTSEAVGAIARKLAQDMSQLQSIDVDEHMDLKHVKDSFERLAAELAAREVASLAQPPPSAFAESARAVIMGGTVLPKRDAG